MSAATATAVEQLAAAGVVAVLRAPSADGAVEASLALARGGVRAVEITFSTPDAVSAIERLVAHDEELLVGAGTVTTLDQLHSVADAGAAFAVSPHTDPALADAARERGLLYLPGALTPTEVVRAAQLGEVVKLFPASLGGPAYLKALLAPFPELRIVPTGGVDAGNVGDWLRAGAMAVGAGGELCPAKLIADGDFDTITERARGFAAALDAYRGATA